MSSKTGQDVIYEDIKDTTNSLPTFDMDENKCYGDDPLWDGAGCGHVSTCCEFNNPPWFYKMLPESTSNNIEMRVCRNEGNTDEDIAIAVYEIYIQ